MTYPASTKPMFKAFDELNAAIVMAQVSADDIWTRSATREIKRTEIVQFYTLLDKTVDELQAITSYSGIGAYAQEQFGDPTIDIVAEFTAMRAELIELRDWIASAFPRDGEGRPVVGNLTFTVAQLSSLRPLIADFLATLS